MKAVCLAALFCLSFAAVSCSDEQQITGGESGGTAETGPVQVKMHLIVPQMNITDNTRADDVIAEVSVMTFDENGYMTDAPQEATISGAGADTRYYVATLNSTTDFRKVVILVNAASRLNVYRDNTASGFPAGEWKVLGEDGITAANATQFDHIEANLKTAALTTKVLGSNTYITGQPADNPPMVGSVELSEGISSTTIIAESFEPDGVTPRPILLKRATAKFTVETDGVIQNFTILGVSLGNAPVSGLIMPQSPVTEVSPLEIFHYAAAASTNEAAGYLTLAGAESSSLSEPLYSYEDSGDNNLLVILRAAYNGVSGYYRINIVDGDYSDDSSLRSQLDIVRNTWYKVRIGSVSNYGYTSVSEAVANRASNIEYTVTVGLLDDGSRDSEPHDIVSNGDYYLGVSNSALVVYDDDGVASGTLLAATMEHSATASVAMAMITVTGTGLTLVPSQGIAVINGGVSATFNPGSASKRFDINIAMSSAFKYTTGGSITIRLGNLTKTITVTRRRFLPMIQGVADDFATGEYVTARTNSELPTPGWLTFSTQPDGYDASDEIDSPAGNIYICYERNIALHGAAVRHAEAFLARNNQSGRVKVFINQEYLNTGDIVDDLPPEGFTPFVGAFWKASQTGERLIRISRPTTGDPTGADGEWTATVIEGEDWILLDTSPSTDNNIWTNSVPHTHNNTSDFDTRHAVNGSDFVSGTLRPSGSTGYQQGDEYIYFRIGLKSTYAPTTNAPARYGVVLLTYKGHEKMYRIFIRQGEGADYLMRPQDTGGSGQTWGTPARPNAKMFLPYNIKDAQHRTATQRSQTNFIGVGGGVWTDYPTMIGYSFVFNRLITSAPINGFVIDGWNNNQAGITAWWTASSAETCPSGYRRPTDGSTSSAGAATVAGSEIRQSLWLNPQNGTTLNAENSLGGYYADGYFDRAAFNTSAGYSTVAYNPGLTPAPSDVRVFAASAGRLFFNPYTYASIFFPAGGDNMSTGQYTQLGNIGEIGEYWTSTAYSTGSSGEGSVLSFNSGTTVTSSTVQMLREPGATLHPIRCVAVTP